jgi:hypothetical protein
MVIAVVVMLLGIAIGSALNYLVDAVTVDLNEGFNEFALFYLIAQAIERFAEFTSYIPWIGARSSGGGTTQRREQDTTGADVGTQLDATKANVTKLRNKARALSVQELAKGNFNAATVKAQEAADRQEDVQVVRANRAVFFLGLNTAIAAVACGYFKLLLLKHVGVNGAGDWLDIAVTAFAIGGGTKPLHDLIKNIQKAKEQGQDSTATT